MIEYTVKEDEDGIKEWFLNGELHREDGPAFEWSDGDKAWYLNGKELTKKQHKKATRKHKEYTVSELEGILGEKIKIVKEGN